MRLVQFAVDKNSTSSRVGVLKDDIVIDCTNEGLPNSLVDLLNQENPLERIQNATIKAHRTYALSEIKLLSPITRPDKILCVGLNYKEHCDELKIPYPPEPIIFSKFGSNIIGPSDNIVRPTTSEELDWEVELVVVIGKKARHVKKDDAYDYVLGYTIGQDLTARDWVHPEKNGGQNILGKALDTFCPLGPYVVTKDEITNPHKLKLKTWINGVVKQDGNTSEMVHKIDKLVSYLSCFMTLYPGDIIMTGTPSGVGYSRNPKETLKAGDVVESEIENIGKLSNTVS